MQNCPKRSIVPFLILAAICLSFVYLFTALGIWQLHRLKWKEGLIAQVNSRLKNPPIIAPLAAEWNKFDFTKLAYLPVKLSGDYLPGKNIYVTALTTYGSGYWLMTPLRRPDSSIVFINRGFVPMDFKNSPKLRQSDLQANITITGLLRPDEGAGWLIHRNKLEADLWYKRDLTAMAQKLQLDPRKVAPYFIDSAKMPDSNYPIGGLTIVRFRNAHLSYAITWFVLALGSLAGLLFLSINEYKQRYS